MINEYSCKVKRGAPAVAIWFGNTLSMKMGTLDLFMGTLKNVPYPFKTSAPAILGLSAVQIPSAWMALSVNCDTIDDGVSQEMG